MDHDVVSVLLDILVVLVAAKAAAEIAERLNFPAVVGEIAAGIVVGPSVLGLVGSGDVLRTLGELGVVLLLLEVGMEMDLAELGKVGRSSLFVATVGVVAPLALGLPAMAAIGFDFNTSLFVAAALTATSVGITARVFGDLRALATTEARVVLGAAVADDVMGLVVLTVVVRIVTEGSVSAVDVVKILLIAIAFLVVGGLLALWIAPRLFDQIERRARSAGTIVALALAFTLAFAELADAAQLAVVVGAFLAGLALGRTLQSERIRRELAPVGHLFIPVFFLQIGIDVDVSSFGQLTVLRDAAILLVVAVVGKLVAAIGTAGTPSDKLLVGLGMLPRGEVGLIFATIGLGAGVLDDDLYAALLLVVLATTLVTPVLLRRRYDQLTARARAADPDRVGTRSTPPPGGWIQVLDGEIALSGRPDPACAAEVALEAARYVARARPSETLLDWFSTNQGQELPWSARATKAFIDLLSAGNARSWRFLDALDVLPRALPELSEALRERRTNPFELDPLRLHRWETLELLAQFRTTDEGAAEWNALVLPERVLVAAFLVDVVSDREDALAATHRFVSRLDLGNAAAHEISTVVHEPDLMLDLARRDGLNQEAVLRLAVHLRGPETARAAYLVAAVRAGTEALHRSHLRELHELVQRAFADPLVGPEAENLVARHRADAAQLVVRPGALIRIEDAPRDYVLSQTPDVIARHAELVSSWDEQKGTNTLVAVATDDIGDDRWWIDVVAGNRQGLLARVAGVLSTMGYDVECAAAVTWPAGPALESFLVTGGSPPDDVHLGSALATAMHAPLRTEPIVDAEVVFDDAASPWYTICEVRAADAPGLLGAIAAAFADAGVDLHGADVSSDGGRAFDRFEVTAGRARLTHETRAAVRHNLATGVELAGHRSLRDRIVSQTKAALSSVTRQPSVSDVKSQPH